MKRPLLAEADRESCLRYLRLVKNGWKPSSCPPDALVTTHVSWTSDQTSQQDAWLGAFLEASPFDACVNPPQDHT